MSDEQFLSRWSRRKCEAQAGEAAPQPEEPVEAQNEVPSAGPAPEAAAPEVDLSSLPPIESIDAATDITAFLRKGIPQELSRAALRRAWSVDPAIRDFVGPAENSWDFNDPNAMAGFGELDYSAEQIDALVRRLVGGAAPAADDPADPIAAAEDAVRSADAEGDREQTSPPKKTLLPLDGFAAAALPPDSAASQPASVEEASEATVVWRRTHGGALPQ